MKPIAILQMQRMGDLVLTFPLIMWLKGLYPDNPSWVVGEEIFFSGLLPVSPHAMYIPWTNTDRLKKREFRLVINLSHRPEAAALAGQLKAEQHLGPVLGPDNITRIHGEWQLYRASLVHNNRHNRFHWADLNAMDIVPPGLRVGSRWPAPKALDRKGNRVGVFLGASEDAKRPHLNFWVGLVRHLQNVNLRPVLLGGPGERELGQKVAGTAGTPALNLCGRFSLPEFAGMLSSLALFITPDTGPMHLAVWRGLPVINLSMGPVNPWETGPYLPGHHVILANMSCTGCWGCDRTRPLACRGSFNPKRLATLALRLTMGEHGGVSRTRLPGLRVMTTGRTSAGLYNLIQADHGREQNLNTARNLLGEFWRQYFGLRLKAWDTEEQDQTLDRSWQALTKVHPALAERFIKGLAGQSARFSGLLKRPNQGPPGDEFWAATPPLLRPLASHMHMRLQNQDYSAASLRQCLEDIEFLLGLAGSAS